MYRISVKDLGQPVQSSSPRRAAGELGEGPLAARTRPWVIGAPRQLRKFRRLYGPGSFLGYAIRVK